MATVEFFDDPAAYLAAAAAYLAAHPVETTVITVWADRCARGGVPDGLPYSWFALVREGDEVVGAAMRSAPVEPYPMYVAGMSQDAARALAGAVIDRGEHPDGVNGSEPAASVVARELARRSGRGLARVVAAPLWELGTLVPPTGVAGLGRLATCDDAELCRQWLDDFRRAVDEQAGRPVPVQAGERHSTAEVRRRIEERRIVVWEVAGEVVHLTGVSHPVFGVGRIGPVYTPAEHRGHSYAAAGVAYGSRLILDAGGQATLFTDRDNPVSNGVYARLGYVPVYETANYLIR